MKIARAAAAALCLAAAQALATPEEYDVDPAHTYPGFAVRHLGISTQRGRFDRTHGRILLDREAGKGSIEIAIDTTSVSSGNPKLDAALRGDDFFHVDKHPRITFKSHVVEFDGEVPKLARGELTLLGVARAVTLDIEHFACTRLPFLVRSTCGADISTSVSRAAFGMDRYPRLIGDEVRIHIQIEAVKIEPPPTPPGG